MGASELAPLRAFLAAPTPEAWYRAAAEQPEVLLVDHANCEKKAASTALSMVFRYEDEAPLVARMSRLAREELRHFELVTGLMARRGMAWRQLSAGRYAAGLRAVVRGGEPARLVDLLVCGAFVEARSAERFAGLVGRLDPELDRFYARLLKSEARHFEVYLDLARAHAGAAELDDRIAAFRAVEAALVTDPDPEFRFHSGPPDQGQSTSASPLASTRA
jgi:tRNA-(ms[2]io[6]A)-hydroxylase